MGYTGKSDTVYYWKPRFDGNKPVFVLNQVKYKADDDIQVFAKAIQNKIHAQNLANWYRTYDESNKTNHKRIMQDIQRHLNIYYKKRRFTPSDRQGSKAKQS